MNKRELMDRLQIVVASILIVCCIAGLSSLLHGCSAPTYDEYYGPAPVKVLPTSVMLLGGHYITKSKFRRLDSVHYGHESWSKNFRVHLNFSSNVASINTAVGGSGILTGGNATVKDSEYLSQLIDTGRFAPDDRRRWMDDYVDEIMRAHAKVCEEEN